MRPNRGQETELVIPVHGTFASIAEDRGDAWWQLGSRTHRELQKRLPPRFSLGLSGRRFHWSGANTERARSRAASELLEFIEPLEASGKRYHLIGHSHGGSVIWATLRMATARNRPLRGLRSWSTVGTPFLHHRSRSPLSMINVVYMVFAALLLVPAVRSLWSLVVLPYRLATGRLDGGIVISHDRDTGFMTALLRRPILQVIEYLGVPRVDTAEGIRLGSFDPDSGQSIAEFLLGTFEGWLILGAILVFGYITLLLGTLFLIPVLEGFRIRMERRLEERAFQQYGSRWLGIWTPDDEAINGLRATMELSVSFVGDLVLREPIFLSDMISLPWRPFYRIVAPIYNHIIQPIIDSKIRDIVVKAAQGNNRPAARVVAVSPHPILPPPADSVPPLPNDVQTLIRNTADINAQDLGGHFRQLLAQPSVVAGLEQFSQDIAGDELVHTSYFEHADVIDLLALNISWSRGRNQPRRAATSDELKQWFRNFKSLQPSDSAESSLISMPGQIPDGPSSPGRQAA